MSALNVSTTLGAPSTSTGALPVAPPIPTMRNPREATLPPSARLDGNSASRLLAHWPQGLDPQLLTSPPSTLKLAIYQQINQKLTEWQDPNCPSYCPGPSHWPALLDHGRFLLIGGGERGGKSRFSSQETAARVTATRLAGKKKAKYWLCGFSYEKTHNEFLNLILLFQALGALPLNLPPTNPYVRKPEGRAWSMRLMGDWDGVEIETRSVEDPATIASWPLDGALLCEPAFCDEEVWLKLRARVAERKGWVIMAGCLVPDTLVLTGDGLLTLAEIVRGVTHPEDRIVHGLDGPDRATLAWNNGATATLRVEAARGFVIEGTPDHRVIARRALLHASGVAGQPHRRADGSITWTRLDALRPGDWLAVRYDTQMFGTLEWPEEQAYLAGLYVAEGSCEPLNRLTYTTAEPEIMGLLRRYGFRQNGRYHWRITHAELADTFRAMGMDLRHKAPTKEVPRGIRGASRATQVAFLRGLFDGDGTAAQKQVRLYTSSPLMARQVRAMLLNLGVAAGVTRRICKLRGQEFPAHVVHVYMPRTFADRVGFALSRKQQVIAATRDPRYTRGQPSFAGGEFLGWPVIWVPVRQIQGGFAQTLDLHVEGSHAYWADGIIAHNTFERMRGQWYKALFLRWQTPGLEGKSYSFPTWENYELFPGGWADPEIQRIREGVDEDWFMERFAGVPVKPTSLVFRQFEPSIHVQPHVTFQPQIGTYEWRGESLVFSGDNTADKWPVELAVDPGNADYAILAIQRGEDDQGGPLVYVFDELFGRNQDTTQLIEICRERPWWKNVNMAYPGTIDTAAKARTGSIPVNKVWRDQGVPLPGRRVRGHQGIDKHRSFLRDFGKQALVDKSGERLYPNARDWARVFVSPRCKRLIEEFQMMRFPERQDPSEWADPERGHDHGIKALWYFLMDRYPGTGRGYETERSGALIFTNG